MCIRDEGAEDWPGVSPEARVIVEADVPIFTVRAAAGVVAWVAFDNATEGSDVYALEEATGRFHRLATSRTDEWNDRPRFNDGDAQDVRVMYVHGSMQRELRLWDPATNGTTALTTGYLPFWNLHEWRGDWAVGDWGRKGAIVAFDLRTQDTMEVQLPPLRNASVRTGTNGYHLAPENKLLATVTEEDGTSTLREVDLVTGRNRTLRAFDEVVVDFLMHPDGSMLHLIEVSQNASWVNRWESATGPSVWLDRPGRRMDSVDLRLDWLVFMEYPEDGFEPELVLYSLPAQKYRNLTWAPDVRTLDYGATAQSVFAAVAKGPHGSETFAILRFPYPA